MNVQCARGATGFGIGVLDSNNGPGSNGRSWPMVQHVPFGKDALNSLKRVIIDRLDRSSEGELP